MADSFYGVAVRPTFDSENDYFRKNPKVGGMAAEDNRIILNPFSALSAEEKQAVARNEAVRVLLRTGQIPRPDFDLTPEQQKSFGGYSKDLQDQRDTITARILSGDPSAGNVSPQQQEFAAMLSRDFLKERK